MSKARRITRLSSHYWRIMTEIRTISTTELQQRLAEGHPPEFWNVQSSPHFSGDLIPGSRSIPLDTIEHGIVGVQRNAEIVTYCGGPQCSQSTAAARRLIALGYTNVRAYHDGLSGWKAAGYR